MTETKIESKAGKILKALEEKEQKKIQKEFIKTANSLAKKHSKLLEILEHV